MRAVKSLLYLVQGKSGLFRKKYIVFLQNELEVADRERRMRAVKSLLYLVQGKSYGQDYQKMNKGNI